MRITEHLIDGTSPHVRVDLTERDSGTPLVYVEISEKKFGATYSLSGTDPEHFEAISEAFKEAARRLRAAKVALVEQVPA